MPDKEGIILRFGEVGLYGAGRTRIKISQWNPFVMAVLSVRERDRERALWDMANN